VKRTPLDALRGAARRLLSHLPRSPPVKADSAYFDRAEVSVLEELVRAMKLTVPLWLMGGCVPQSVGTAAGSALRQCCVNHF
jgi:hypothetical protein